MGEGEDNGREKEVRRKGRREEKVRGRESSTVSV